MSYIVQPDGTVSVITRDQPFVPAQTPAAGLPPERQQLVVDQALASYWKDKQ